MPSAASVAYRRQLMLRKGWDGIRALNAWNRRGLSPQSSDSSDEGPSPQRRRLH